MNTDDVMKLMPTIGHETQAKIRKALDQLVVNAREGAFCEAADAIGGLYSTKPRDAVNVMRTPEELKHAPAVDVPSYGTFEELAVRVGALEEDFSVASSALSKRVDALERVLSRHAETLGFLDYERVQPLEARVSTLKASQPSTQNAWDAYRFVMDSEHPGAAYRDVERMAVDAAVRATTNTGEGSMDGQTDGSNRRAASSEAPVHGHAPSPAPSASEIPAWVPTPDEIREAIYEGNPSSILGLLALHYEPLRRLIASRAPRASTVSVEAVRAHVDAANAMHGRLEGTNEDDTRPTWELLNDYEEARSALSALPASEAPQPSRRVLTLDEVAEDVLMLASRVFRLERAQPAPASTPSNVPVAKLAHVMGDEPVAEAMHRDGVAGSIPAGDTTSTPDEGEIDDMLDVELWANHLGSVVCKWPNPKLRDCAEDLARTALRLSSSRTPRVDAEFIEVADCLRDRFDLLYRMNGAFNPRDAKETAHDEECLADYDRVREGVECAARTPRVDVRRLLASYYGEDPFDRNVERMTAALKAQGVECVGDATPERAKEGK